MSRILVVAWYTFLEGVRARFFIGALAVSLFVVALGGIVASMPYGRVDQMVLRLGWGAIFLSGFIISVFYSIQATARERDQRVLLLMWSKPIGRMSYALGKFTGMLGLTGTMVAVEGIALLSLLAVVGEQLGHRWVFEWIVPTAFITLKCGVLLAFAAFFGTIFITPMVAMLLTGGFYMVGIGSQDLLKWAIYLEHPDLIKAAKVLTWAAPQFSRLDVSGWVTYGIDVVPATYGFAALYFGGYMLIGLVAYMLAAATIELK